MGLYNDEIWQRMSAETYAAEIKEAMGEAAWVEAYARHLCCDDPQSQRFTFQVLKILGWTKVIEATKPKPSLMARFFVTNIPAALEGTQVRMGVHDLHHGSLPQSPQKQQL